MAAGLTGAAILGRIPGRIILSDPAPLPPQQSFQSCEFCHGRGRLRSTSSFPGISPQRFQQRRGATVISAAMAMAATQEAFVPSRDSRREHLEQSFVAAPSPRNRADDASLNNPLLRRERMGCGWLGVIMEWEGVVVEEDLSLDRKAWRAIAEEEGKSLPPAFLLKRAAGMKNEQAISEVLCWSRDFQHIKRMAKRKEDLYQYMQRGTYRLLPGSRDFVQALKRYKVPISVASTRPRRITERAIEAVGMEGFFDEVVAAEDVYRGKPDPEMFLYAAERLGFIPERCIVFGSSNSSVEAAHDARMKCVAVAGTHPVFELGAADLVVKRLTELSVVDLKNLADLDAPEFQAPEPQLEESREEDRDLEERRFMAL
ncbi:5-amino-6-(5-phospho-D-ribitylamino)uracil phosphatase, chloroplastic-like [Selaginella moellendorffii]|uniref:5-amino-6-(5-phospho-D-ribitylamino)uracil phosphatase, chloroplastic-like n=1 Tax=Selaginella moellendorffii TaxID=88036 RepID=UPI000D1C3DF1|nr:5-amino-6-(5-phospho-D-ribitylamino)uracil phosphatase, chloroplastic-like [Selaginella moellendorffii]|eukprot:XP_024534664.1 5-amino-6-(5-phospho-D-ribitylamino)uracil phosphatase, chloroplastic-like [Selaginella moellendorffii]